jgi:hypothetical protein
MTNKITPPAAASHEGEVVVSARTDFLSALGWMALGTAILIGSITMDRLKNQDINPYTIPGLLPGLLGIAMIILGALLAARSWHTGIFQAGIFNAHTAEVDAAARRAERTQLLIVLGLCIGFGVVLVGHGLPFWLAAAIFVSISILVLQRKQRKAAGEKLQPRTIIKAVAIGLGAGLAITIVFQEIFLVRLP